MKDVEGLSNKHSEKNNVCKTLQECLLEVERGDAQAQYYP